MKGRGEMTKKIVLITGATSGIGRHAALDLARRGYRVFATGRRKEALAGLKAEADGLELEGFEMDVTSADSIAAAVAEIDRATGGHGVDVLVNNAGYGELGPLEQISDADLRRQYETNVFGLMAVTRAFLPRMRQRRAGRVVNISSIGGRTTVPFMGAYNSTKYAVESLSDALRNEMAPFGVEVVLVEPGPIRTEFSDRSMEQLSKYGDPDSPYAAVFARARKIEAQIDATAVGPEHTSWAIRRAIEARRPLARYVVPWRSYAALLAFATLPTRVMDWLLRTFLGLSRL
jgi:short-subunit dehydrogenase